MALRTVQPDSEVSYSLTGETEAVIHGSVGVMAVNEAANIGNCLTSLLNQRLKHAVLEEILVVVSGSTDGTAAIVQEFSRRDARIQLVQQARREGKASAVNLFLRRSQYPVVVLVGADTILHPDTLEHLLCPFLDPEVGMTGGHPIPTNDPNAFMGFAAHLLWGLHHQLALKRPKLGELIAFRRIFERIPPYSAVDEASIETLVCGQAYAMRYVPEAIVFNRGPATVADFLKQRRRIYAGHIRLQQIQGYHVATMSGLAILLTLLANPVWHWRWFALTPFIVALEVWGRCLGWHDVYIARNSHTVWDLAVSTKKVEN
jgi:cellulose synthase/poly-beta-1,6-N-acetylglucosamine synthase-like glycosyltransferase